MQERHRRRKVSPLKKKYDEGRVLPAPTTKHPEIDIDRFPEQASMLHQRVEVTFSRGGSSVMGFIVRDDVGPAGGLTIIKLDDGRFVLGTECYYTSAMPLLKRIGE